MFFAVWCFTAWSLVTVVNRPLRVVGLSALQSLLKKGFYGLQGCWVFEVATISRIRVFTISGVGN